MCTYMLHKHTIYITHTHTKINNDKNYLLKMINKINKSLERLSKIKRESTSYQCQIERKGNITTISQKINIRGYFEQLKASKLENVN